MMPSVQTLPRRGWKTGLAAALALMLSGCGLMAPRGNEGYADLDSLGVFDTDRRIALSLGPVIIHFAARFIDDDPETKEMLRSIDGVRVRIYEIDGDGLRVAARMQDMSDALRADGWEPVALMREEREQTHMLVKTSRGEIRGLTVLTSDGEEEAVVVNLMGNLEPRFFSDAMVALEVDVPEVEVAAE
jgi:hypothetical protein